MDEILDWLSTGRTLLIMNDREKGNGVTNFRPRIFLPLMYNKFAGILSYNCLIIWKMRHCCQINKRNDEENRGGKRKNCCLIERF